MENQINISINLFLHNLLYILIFSLPTTMKDDFLFRILRESEKRQQKIDSKNRDEEARKRAEELNKKRGLALVKYERIRSYKINYLMTGYHVIVPDEDIHEKGLEEKLIKLSNLKFSVSEYERYMRKFNDELEEMRDIIWDVKPLHLKERMWLFALILIIMAVSLSLLVKML